jgi:hypothetical protein
MTKAAGTEWLFPSFFEDPLDAGGARPDIEGKEAVSFVADSTGVR